MMYSEFCEKTGLGVSKDFFDEVICPVYERYVCFTSPTNFFDYVAKAGVQGLQYLADKLIAADTIGSDLYDESQKIRDHGRGLIAVSKELSDIRFEGNYLDHKLLSSHTIAVLMEAEVALEEEAESVFKKAQGFERLRDQHYESKGILDINVN